MSLGVLILTLIAAIVSAGSAFAVTPGKTAAYQGGGIGRVVFDGKVHADKDLKCMDCHTKIFPMKKGSSVKITKADMDAGRYCGACHNGREAFNAGDKANCSKCHKK